MRDPRDDSELSRRFRESASTSAPRAPLYAALSAGICRDRDLYRLLKHAPVDQRLPVLLFACVHTMVLSEPEHPLAQWYPNLTEAHRSPDDPALMPTFKAFVQERAEPLAQLLATKSTQTNEVGRCIMMLPPMARLSEAVGELAMLDIGTSGGLNLLIDRYEYHYVPDDDTSDRVHVLGEPSTVVLTTKTRGDIRVPPAMPTISARCGVDLKPVDVTDDGEAHWLEACVWPDQRERFLRLAAAIDLARADPPEILAGDAVSSLDPAIERMSRSGHTVVTTSWALNYLPEDQRVAFLAELDRIGADCDLSWIFVEGPALTSGLPWGPGREEQHTTVTALASWRNGSRSVEYLTTSHPHGYWMHAIN